MEDEDRLYTCAPTTIVANQLGCQLEPKVRDSCLGAFIRVLLHQSEGIRDGDIK